MHRVGENLYVGGSGAVADHRALGEADIATVVGLTHDPPTGDYPDGVRVVREPMMDGPRNDADAFERAVDATLDALAAGRPTLVHCSAGSSRSVAVAATALACATDRGLERALGTVLDRRPPADPHPALVRRAASYVTRRETESY
jgi:atypical dual specificity phosphatase